MYFAAFSSCHLAKKMTTVLAGCHRGELFFGLTPGDFPFAWLACEQTRLLFTICPKWRASSHAFPFLALLIIACEQALLFGRTKRSAREHASGRQRPSSPPLSRLLSRSSRASTFHYIPQMESWLAGYCLYHYSLAISLSWVMFSVTVTLKGPHVRVSGSFYSLKHSTVSISC